VSVARDCAPAPAPTSAAATRPAATTTAAAAGKPKTVMVSPQELAAAAAAGLPAATLESRLHGSMPRLFVKGDTLKRRMRLMKATSKIGRAETADLLLPHESVSELHAEITFDGTGFALRDHGSTNGSLVDGALLRNQSQPIGRNSLLGFGNLRAIFLCNDPAHAASDRRLEERALRLLIAAGRLGRDVGHQALQFARSDASQSIAEILLMDTPIDPADWANAIQAARSRVTLVDRLRALLARFTRRPAPGAR